MSRPDPRRIGLIVLVLIVGVVLLAWYRSRPRAERVATTSTPAFDAADVAVRLTLKQVSHLYSPLANPDLSENCVRGHPDTWRVLESPGFDFQRADAVARALLFTSRGNGARMEYGERGLWPDAPLTRRFASIDGPAREAWLDSLRVGGYPTAWPPVGEYLCGHSAWVAIESCVGGRYYATLRTCEVSPMHAFVRRLLDGAAATTRDGTPRE